MASLILIASRQETFSYLAMFCKIYRYPKHRKTLSWGKLLLTSHYQTLTKQNHHVGQVLFMVNLFSIFGWVVCCFFPGQPILLKIGCPVNFLVVSDDRTTANFEHCKCIFSTVNQMFGSSSQLPITAKHCFFVWTVLCSMIWLPRAQQQSSTINTLLFQTQNHLLGFAP